MRYTDLQWRYLALLRMALTRMDLGDLAVKPFEGEATDRPAPKPYDPYKRERGKDWPFWAETMIGKRRLDHLNEILLKVRVHGVGGHYAECGIWRGGTCIYARAFFDTMDEPDRKVFGFDSFQGLPEGGYYEQDQGDPHHTQNDIFAVSREEVLANFSKYAIDMVNVDLIEGWFRDTLPAWSERNRSSISGAEKIEAAQHPLPLAVLRIDGDMYEGTMDPLKYLYPHVAKGGFVIVDDYGDVRASRRAVHDYLGSLPGAQPQIFEIDHTAIYWRKQ